MHSHCFGHQGGLIDHDLGGTPIERRRSDRKTQAHFLDSRHIYCYIHGYVHSGEVSEEA